MPDPDLVIRTSGEQRISNFLLWQLAYSRARVRGHPVARLRRRADLRTGCRRLLEADGGGTADRSEHSSSGTGILIAAAGIPLVLWLVYLGGWPMFGLAAVGALSRCTSSTG